jgi:K+-sensing histidine kinase KdpD
MVKVLLAGKAEWEDLRSGLSPFGYEFVCFSTEEAVRDGLKDPAVDLVLIGERETPNWERWCRTIRDEFLDETVPIVGRIPRGALEEGISALEEGLDDVLFVEADPGAVHSRIKSLLKARVRLKRLQDLQRAREELTQIVVHDLKSPLTLIMVELGMLERWWAKGVTERFLRSLTRLNQKCEELAGHVHAVVDAGKLEQGKLAVNPSRMSIQILVRDALSQFGPKAEARGVRVDMELDGPDGFASLDPDLSLRAFATLLEVTLRLTTEGGRIVATTTVQDGRVRIGIAGGDRPLPPEVLDRFFDPFAYLERRPLGLNAIAGLGLHFAQMLFDSHGGAVKVRNSGEEGFLFEVLLPLVS